jgi:hypothetical protein
MIPELNEELIQREAEKSKAAKPEEKSDAVGKTDRPPEGEDVDGSKEVSRDDAHAWR